MDSDRSENMVARLALIGVLVNIGLAGVKLVAGLLGHSYALIADAIESLVDIVGSLVIWLGIKYAQRPPDAEHPYGHGRAESLAALAVAGMVVLAGIGIAIKSIEEILTPKHAPAWWTLLVLVVVVIVKETMARVASGAARRVGSTVGAVDAGHHRSDALTSAAAFVGILIAVVAGPGWESADDWAALVASGIILFNGYKLARPPLDELLDRQPDELVARAVEIAGSVAGVNRVQKAWARKSGHCYYIDMHVWVDPRMEVVEAHRISHAVKDSVRGELRSVRDVLVHIEPDGSHQEPARV